MMRGNERGLSNSVQTALLFPLVLSILWLAMQWAMLSWAQATAQAAAQEGARTTATLGGTVAAGEQRARAATDNGAIQTASVSITRGAATTTATITGHALQVIPGFPVDFETTATAPTQDITGG